MVDTGSALLVSLVYLVLILLANGFMVTSTTVLLTMVTCFLMVNNA